MPTLLLTTGADTEISLTGPSNNFGASTQIRAGRSTAGGQVRRFLIKPDITSLLALPGITITGADLRLWCQTVLDGSSRPIHCHRMLLAFFEGVQNGAPPGAADGSTWNQRNANTGAPLSWGVAGGLAGTDYATTATDTQTVSVSTAFYTWNVLADIQAAYAGSITWHGWMMRMVAADEASNSSNKTLASYQFATSTEWPLLTVTYSAPGLLPKMMQYGQYSGGTL